MKDKLIKLVKDNFHLLKNDSIDDYVDIIYDFYVNNNILNENENIFYYGEDDFNIHNTQDTKEVIKNDILCGKHEDRYEDDEPIIISYDENQLIDSLCMTLEQYHYYL